MIDHLHPLLLGSASPRRRDLLAALGLPLRVHAVDVDESTRAGEGALAYLERVTARKLEALLQEPAVTGAGALLVADTTVVLDGAILGKPGDDAEARAMIGALSGRDHEVCTRFAIAGGGADAPVHSETVTTRVRFRALTPAEVEGYVATGEGRDKAGSYAIQGIGSFAVERIDGSYANVVGLPACEVISALLRLGLLARFPVPLVSGR